MTIRWTTVPLGDVITLQRGFDLPERDRVEGNVPIVSSSGITGYHSEAKVTAPGVVTGRYGTLGEVFYVGVDFWPLNTTLWVKDFKGNCPHFISYLLRTLHLGTQNAAGAIPGLNRNALHLLPVRVPPRSIQERVASILSAYDDLIENNNRRITILEDMAQMIYREWFVSLRFPGHEKAKMVESELGLIPQGWHVARVQDFGEIITGKTPSKEHPEFFGTDIPFIKLPDMHGKVFVLDTAEHLSMLGQRQQATKTIPPNTLCVSCIGTAGIVIITNRPSQTNQQINSVVLRSVTDREFLYFRLLDLRETINQYGANGVTMVNLNKTKFENLRVVSPQEGLVKRFHSYVSPMFEQIRNCEQCVATLSQTRDLLLPKLISGEIEVGKIEAKAVAQSV
jgi:type I restriction enzyme S subunit